METVKVLFLYSDDRRVRDWIYHDLLDYGFRQFAKPRFTPSIKMIRVLDVRAPSQELTSHLETSVYVFIIGSDEFNRRIARSHWKRFRGSHESKFIHVYDGKEASRILRWGLRENPKTKKPMLLIPVSAQRDMHPTKEPVHAPAFGPPSPAKTGAKQPTSLKVYDVWYATNRLPKQNAQKLYSGRRAKELSYGCCQVSIPKSHRIGSIGTSWLRRVLRMQFSDDRLRIRAHDPLTQHDFWGRLETKLHTWPQGERICLLFIHGYNVPFVESILRAAQLGFDLKIPLTALFSWPSGGRLLNYGGDAATIRATTQFIETFLVRMLNVHGIERLHLVAHSMGNVGALCTLEQLAHKMRGILPIPLGQVILAAPDVDADEFSRLVVAHKDLSDRTTTYVCSKDLALKASEIVHGKNRRAGYGPPITPFIGTDTIDATHVCFDWLRHGYYAGARDVLKDMFSLIHYGAPPEKRQGISKRNAQDGNVYWAFDAVGS